MAMQLSFSNLLQFFSSISPLLLAFFLVTLSMFNQDLKGLVYLGGVLIASLINLIIMNTAQVKSDQLIPPSCNLIEFPFNLNEYVSPAFNSMFISFTFIYLLMPMIFISSINLPVIICMSLLLVLDGATKIMAGCTSFWGVGSGILVGGILGFFYYLVFTSTGKNDLLFFNAEPSNNVVCSRPKKQSYKCSVYKNGSLVKSQTE
jgi:hypothetical protein